VTIFVMGVHLVDRYVHSINARLSASTGVQGWYCMHRLIEKVSNAHSLVHKAMARSAYTRSRREATMQQRA